MRFIKTFEAKNKFQNKQFQIKLNNLEEIKKEINEIAYILEDDGIYISQESGVLDPKLFEHFINIEFAVSTFDKGFNDYFYAIEDAYNEFFDRCVEICKKYNFKIEKLEEYINLLYKNRKDPSVLIIRPDGHE